MPDRAVPSAAVAVGCVHCGPGAVPAELTTVLGDVDTGAHYLAFVCPHCGRRAMRLVPVDDVAGLVLGGAALRALTRPAEAVERPDAPPLTEAEVADFAARLERPGWESALFE